MGTRSTIAIIEKNGLVKSIYAHFDGYLEGNGFILHQYYQDAEKVKKLIELGAVESLDKEIDPPAGAEHNHETKSPGVTTFFVRDYGEKEEGGNKTKEFSSLEDYIKNCEFEDYNYIFDENKNKWFSINMNDELNDLEATLLKDKSVSEDVKKIILSKSLPDNLNQGNS